MKNNGYFNRETCHDCYPNLRESLASDYAELAPEEIDELVEETFGPAVSAGDMEDVFESLGGLVGQIGQTVSQVAAKAGPSVSKALPGAAQGAASGAAFGPWGMLAGALLGGVGKTLGGRKGAAPTMGNLQTGGAGLAGTAGNGAGVPAAGQLLNLLGRPEVLQALQAMMLSPVGRTTVPVGQTPVPTGAFTNLLAMLANQAQAQLTAGAGAQPEAVPEYLMESSGEYRCDPADPGQRAEVLWQLLQQSESPNKSLDDFGEDDEAADDYYDAMEIAELNLEERR